MSKNYLQLWFPTLGSDEPLGPLSSISIKTDLMKNTNDLLGVKPNGYLLVFIIFNLGQGQGSMNGQPFPPSCSFFLGS